MRKTRPLDQPTPCPVEVTLQHIAPTPAQAQAWQWLWRRLLADSPKNTNPECRTAGGYTIDESAFHTTT
jgi:hypothetical protein